MTPHAKSLSEQYYDDAAGRLRLIFRNDTPTLSLGVLQGLRQKLAVQEQDLVLLCRHDGLSWAAIASQLGMTRQAAQQKFG